jgi:exosortase/archaeosortase family protein
MNSLKRIINDKRLLPVRNVAIFAILILGFHYFFRWWAYGDNKYWPIADIIYPLYDYLTNLLYTNSKWVITHLTNVTFTFDDQLHKFYSSDGYVGVNHGCSGLKQFLQWTVLMIFFPGPWKKKLWFIPAGLIIVHIVNILRITSLVILVSCDVSQSTWDFAHDWIMRPFFYVVMFGMWVIWVDNISVKRNKNKP